MTQRIHFYRPSELNICNKVNAIFDEKILRESMEYLGLQFNFRFVNIQLSSTGYPTFKCQGHIYRVHRIIGQFIYKDIKGLYDYHHIDGNKLNASTINIQPVSSSEHIKLHATGKHISEEHKEALRQAHLGRTPKNIKAIVMLNREGNFVAEFSSIKDAAQQLGIWRTSIDNNLNGRSKYCNNHKFVYKDEYTS